jgi:hypothetical protein
MMNLAVWLKKNGFRADQVQTFYPSPMATATAMYHSNKNPLRKVGRASETVDIVRGDKRRRLHKAFLRYHDPNNWPLLREALKTLGRADLIGNGKHHLIPTFQPLTDGSYQSARRKNSTAAPAAENLSKNLEGIVKSTAPTASTHSALKGRMAVAVVGRTFAGIAQDLVGLADFFEFRLGRIVVRIFVGMEFDRELAVGLLEVVLGDASFDSENLVVVALAAH